MRFTRIEQLLEKSPMLRLSKDIFRLNIYHNLRAVGLKDYVDTY